jgi:hypothetical protein
MLRGCGIPHYAMETRHSKVLRRSTLCHGYAAYCVVVEFHTCYEDVSCYGVESLTTTLWGLSIL